MPASAMSAEAVAAPAARSWLDRAEACLGRVEEVLAIGLVVAIAALVNLQVVARYLFHAPFIWPEEVTKLMLVWLAFLAAAAVSRRGADMAVTTFTDMMPPGLRRAVAVLRDVVLAGLYLLVAWEARRLVEALSGMTLVATDWPVALLVWPLLLGSLLLALHAAARLVREAGA